MGKDKLTDIENFSEGYDFAYDKSHDWLVEHWNDYFTEDGDFNGWRMITDYRKHMEA